MEFEMKRRWLQLWAASGYPTSQERLDSLFNDLVRHYSEPQRAYHVLGHEHCLIEFDTVRRHAEHPLAVEFALWYHDAVYLPKNHDNEACSALMLAFVMTEMNATLWFTQKICGHIFATKHDGVAGSNDSKLVVDIDLSILGQPEDVFDEYERQIRFEYHPDWVPEDKYRAGRMAVLQQFLDRPTIYQTPHFQDKYERQAQVNLTRSIKKLQLA
jgi:predicted metal-dependent HD superfamily phosphohydrolase